MDKPDFISEADWHGFMEANTGNGDTVNFSLWRIVEKLMEEVEALRAKVAALEGHGPPGG
jgi:hypothetical protein